MFGFIDLNPHYCPFSGSLVDEVENVIISMIYHINYVFEIKHKT